MRSHALFHGFLALFAAAAGCSSVDVAPLRPEEVAQIEQMSSHPDGVYRLEPGDTLEIRYPFHPEMNQTEVIRPDGRIRAKGLGDVPAAGRTTMELRDALLERASKRLRDPQISVSIADFAPKTVYVAGEVGKPGPIPFQKNMTPLRAIAEAGGFRSTARVDQVVLTRAVREGTISRTLDLERVLKDGAEEPIRLAPHDVVYVPRSTIAEANIWVDQHFTQLFPFIRGAGGKINAGQ